MSTVKRSQMRYVYAQDLLYPTAPPDATLVDDGKRFGCRYYVTTRELPEKEAKEHGMSYVITLGKGYTYG